MLKRQRILLQLLADSGGTLNRTRLFKLAFLLSRLGKANCLENFYEFLPYLYGPYSFTLNHELDNLACSGMVNFNDDGKITLSAKGGEAANSLNEPGLSDDRKLIRNEYGKLGQQSLIQTVYKQYPWFTVKSSKALAKNATQINCRCTNYTIGYQAYQVDGLLNFLLKQGIPAAYRYET